MTVQIAFQVYWVSGGLVGVLFASALPAPVKGLEFALCALFVTLTLDAARSRAQVPSLLLAGLSFTAAIVFAPDAALFVALGLFVLLLLGRFVFGVYRARTGRFTSAASMEDYDA